MVPQVLLAAAEAVVAAAVVVSARSSSLSEGVAVAAVVPEGEARLVRVPTTVAPRSRFTSTILHRF
jgi:hypothetical protein